MQISSSSCLRTAYGNSVVERCELVLAETVVDEADYFVDGAGVEHRIDLQPDIAAGRIRVVSVSASEIGSFQAD